MSDTNGTCEYVLDPDDPSTWGGKEGDECYVKEEVLNEDGVWTCPHDAEEGEDLCIFHLPVDEKNDEKVVDSFVGVIKDLRDVDNTNKQIRTNQFVGAKFGVFDLSSKVESIDRNIHLDHSMIREYLDYSDIKFNSQIMTFDGSIFKSYTEFAGANIECRVTFRGSEFKGSISFGDVIFNKDVIFRNSVFYNKTAFRGAEFKQKVDFLHTIFKMECNFRHSIFGGEALFTESRFQGEAKFHRAEFGGKTLFTRVVFQNGASVKFEKSKFKDYTEFIEVNFNNSVSFAGVHCLGAVFFREAEFSTAVFNSIEFEDDVFIEKANFKNNVEFKKSTFRGNVSFQDTYFCGRSDFRLSSFDAIANFTDSTFEDDATFIGSEFGEGAGFKTTSFNGDAIFSKTIFREETSFREALFSEKAEFRETKFNGDIEFSNVDLRDANFIECDLTDSNFTQADLRRVIFESAMLSRATLFGSDLRGAKLSGAVLGDVRIDEDTKFLGHPSGDSDTSPHTLSAIRSRPKCVYDPDYEEDNKHEDVDKAKSVYRALEELGRKHARPRLQARSFVRRQDLQKQDYWNDATADDTTLEERFIAGARWSRAKVARATLLYGESPWRVIAWSLGIIFSFALLYPLGGWMKPADGDPITYAQIASNPVEILNSVYYSTLTYTALGFGDFQPEGFGRLLTTVETGFGAVMLALLVFILGRRAAR